MSSKFECPVIEIKQMLKHPNADTLSLTNAFAYPVVVRTEDFKVGDKVVYVPIDAIVPVDNPHFTFLGKHNRIKAARLRGIFSMGLLVPADPDMELGSDVAERWGIKKWEPPEEGISNDGKLKTGGDCEHVPFFFPRYDVENYLRYPNVFQDGEEVVVTEKIHGANSRFIWKDERLWVGSHNTAKKPDTTNMWWRLAAQYDLENKLKNAPNMIFYGEAYGCVQDLNYGAAPGQAFLRFFDIFDLQTGGWLDYLQFRAVIDNLGLLPVPVLFCGPWNKDFIQGFVDGKTALDGDHIREGIVIKTAKERFDQIIGRPMLKWVSEAYLLRKNGTERH